jgi:hypothetical protein
MNAAQMNATHMLPAAHVHVDQFLSQYSALLGWVVVAMGVFYVIYGVRHYARLRPISRSLAHVCLNVVVCGTVLYTALGAVQSSTSTLANLGFLSAHVIVVGMLAALVSGAMVAFARQPDVAARARRTFWLRRFTWGVLAGFVAGPVVGTLAEPALAGSPALGFAPPGRGLLLMGDVFGIIAGWLVVAPITGVVNVARVYLEERAAKLPANWVPSVGTALALCGIVLTGFSPFSPETMHAVAHSIILPLVSR